MNLSPDLLTPPPRMIRFGHMSLSILSRCSSRSCAQAFQERPRRIRAAAAERRSAARPRISICPNSVLGTSTPSYEDAGPDARAEGQEDDRARLLATDAEAHLGDPGGVGVVDDDDRAPGRLAQPLDDREADPRLVDVAGGLERVPSHGHAGQPDADRRGRPEPARLRQPLRRAGRSRRSTASGVDGFGVATRSRSPRNRPASTSTTAALIPLPPTSMPMASRPLDASARTSVIGCSLAQK